MQFDYNTCREISFKDLFDGRLERFGIHEEIIEGSTDKTFRCLVDGQNHCAWIWGDEEVILIKRNPYRATGIQCQRLNHGYDDIQRT